MKPIIKATVGELFEADMLAANWGLSLVNVTKANANANYIGSWSYNRPTGGDSSPYRLLDFNGYDHYSTSPLIFTFNDLSSICAFDALSGTPPVVLVRARINGTQASNGVGVNGIYLTDMLYGATTTEKLQGLRPCVTRYANGVLFVANASHAFSETSYLDGNAIVLENFNIWDGGWTNSSPSDWTGTVSIPADATNVKYMYLYPRINVMGNVSNLYMTTGGTPTNTPGNNGYYNQNATYPFIGVPQSNYLTLIRYEYSPITIQMGYASIRYGAAGTIFIQTWNYLEQNNLSYTNSGIQGLGGRTIPYSTAPVTVSIIATLFNSANYSVQVRPTTISGGGSAIPDESCTFVSSSETATSTSGAITIPAKGNVQITININYTQGRFSNYTFPSINQPGYGTLYVIPKMRMFVSGILRDVFTPNQQGAVKALNWR